MRDPLVTRRLLAAIDRNLDVYVCLDRFRQAIYDQDDYIAKLERDIKLLQDAERERMTATGVHREIKTAFTARELKVSKWLIGALGAGAGTLLIALITWVGSLAYRGFSK